MIELIFANFLMGDVLNQFQPMGQYKLWPFDLLFVGSLTDQTCSGFRGEFSA